MSVRWALFLSGRGSTAQALLDQIGDLDIRFVVTSKQKAGGILRARRAGLPILHFAKDGNWGELHSELVSRGIQAIFLTGFMRLLPADFVTNWQGRIWNVHPSLLPAYPGAGSMEKSFSDKARMGVTVHEVTHQMDAGPCCLQAEIDNSTDWESVTTRMARLEQRLLREWALRVQRQWRLA